MISRKGISPLIAAVLLIAFTMAIASLFAQWAPSLMQSAQSGVDESQSDVISAASSTMKIQKASFNSSSGNYTVTVQNTGSANITNYTFTTYDNNPTQKRVSGTLEPKEIKTVEVSTSDSSKQKIGVEAENVPSGVTVESDQVEEDSSSTGGNGGGGGSNSAPTASFTDNVSSPEVGDVIEFDGTGSSDSDGSISSYEWDWTNDGTYEGSGSTATHSYSSSGDYTVKLKVTDDGGKTDTTTNTVSVSESGPDGSKLYVMGNGNDKVFEYDVSPKYDSSTASNVASYSVSSQSSSGQEVKFSKNGSRMYVLDYGDEAIYQYWLSTAWDVSTASYTSTSFSVSGEEGSPTGLAWNDDGTKVYIVGQRQDSVQEYTVGTAFDLGSTVTHQNSFNLGQDKASGVYWKPDGTKMYSTGHSSENVTSWDAATAFDTSTLTYSDSFTHSEFDNYPDSITWNNNGTKFYVINRDTNTLAEFSAGTDYSVGSMTHQDSIDISEDGSTSGITWGK